MGFEVGVKVEGNTVQNLYPQSRVVFSGVGIRRKRSKRSALRCIARRLCFFEKRGRCSVESVEWGGYRFWGVW